MPYLRNDQVRRAHAVLRKAVRKKAGSVEAAFDAIDADGSGLLRRAEVRAASSDSS